MATVNRKLPFAENPKCNFTGMNLVETKGFGLSDYSIQAVALKFMHTQKQIAEEGIKLQKRIIELQIKEPVINESNATEYQKIALDYKFLEGEIKAMDKFINEILNPYHEQLNSLN